MTSTKPRAAPRSQIRINSNRSAIIDVNSLKDKVKIQVTIAGVWGVKGSSSYFVNINNISP